MGKLPAVGDGAGRSIDLIQLAGVPWQGLLPLDPSREHGSVDSGKGAPTGRQLSRAGKGRQSIVKQCGYVVWDKL